MRRFIALSILLAGGCAPAEPTSDTAVDINGAAEQAQGSINAYRANSVVADEPERPVAAPEPLAPPAPGRPGGLPDDPTPVSEGSFAPDSAQGAANVVHTYYALVGEGKYRQAWALWGDGGRASGTTAAAFAARFAPYGEYHANIGAPGRVDAGAGQRRVTVPVQVYGRLRRSGQPFALSGSAVLHRTAEIDGATAEQRRWHLASIDVEPAPAAADAASVTTVAASRYRCIDGSRMEVALDRALETATVRSDGRVQAVLQRRADPTGNRFARTGYDLRITGATATYTRAGAPPLACAAR